MKKEVELDLRKCEEKQRDQLVEENLYVDSPKHTE